MCGGGQTTTSSSQPPQVVQDAYQQLLNRGTAVANQPLQQYSGPLVAGFTPAQMSAFQTINNSQGVADPYINAAAGLASQAATPITPMQFSPSAVGQYESPYTQDVVNATMGNLNEANAEQQQQVVGNAISKGAWGGDRAGIAQAELARQQALAEGQTIAGLRNQGYSQALGEFNTQQQANVGAQEASNWLAANAGFQMGALGNEAQNTALTGAQAQLGAGALQQQLAQEELNIPYEQFLQQQAYPYQTTNFLAGLTEGAGSGMGGTSSTTTPGPSTGSQVAGGLLTAGALAAMFMRRGGGVRAYDNGGMIPGFSPVDPSIPDVSVSFIPTPTAMRGPGAPPPPKPPAQQDSSQQGLNALALAKDIKALRGPSSTGTGYMGTLPNGFGEVSSTDMLSGMGYGTLPEGSDAAAMSAMTGMGRGGVAGYADGGAPSPMIAGFTEAPGRGIAIPVLGTPQAGFTPIDIRPTSFYAPPPVTSLPHTTIPLPSNITSPPPFNPPAPTPAPVASSDPNYQPGMGLYGNMNWRRGGPIHHAVGGIVLPEMGGTGFDNGGQVASAGMMSAGMPFAGGNPMMAGLLRRYSQMPTEKLQEYAVRVPPTSPYGRAVRMALQMRHMNPGVDPGMQQQQAGFAQAPQIAQAPQGASAPQPTGQTPPPGTMYRGGVAGFVGGGKARSADPYPPGYVFRDDNGVPTAQVDSSGTLVPVGRVNGHYYAGPNALGWRPPILTNPEQYIGPEVSGPRAGFADGGAPDDLVMDDTGNYVPLSQAKVAGDGANDVQAQPLPAPSRPPENVGTDIIPPPQAGMAPPPAASLAGDQPNALNPNAGMAPPPAAPAKPASAPAPESRDYAASPWMPVVTAGLGMLSSRSPNALQAIGEGGLMGVKELAEQRGQAAKEQQNQNEAQYRNESIEARKQGYDIEAKRLADLADQTKQRIATEQDRNNIERDRLNQGHFTYQQGEGDDGTGHKVPGVWQLDSSGQHDPKFLPQVTITGKGNSQASVFEQKRRAWLQIHPNDQQGALDYGAGHRQMTDQDIMKSARGMADNELKSMTVPPSDPSTWLDQRTAQIAQQIKGGMGGTTPKPALAPAATPQATPAQKPKAAPVAPAYTAQNPWRAPQGADQKTIMEQFNALPKGAIYINPADGKPYRKQ